MISLSYRAALWALMLLTVVSTLYCCDSDDKKKLPGERIAVLQNPEGVEPDERLAATAVAVPPPRANAEWPQAGGNAAHVLDHLQLADALNLLWQVDIGQGSSDDSLLLAAPIVAQQTVYTIDTESVVRASNLESGAKLWKTDVTPEDQDSSPVLAGGLAYSGKRIYVASGFAQLVTLDAESGKELWRVALPAPAHAPPTINSGRVFVITTDNQLVALSADDGHKLWNYNSVGEAAGLLGSASPAADQGIVIAAYTTGEIYALRIETGTVVWSENLAAVRRADAVSAIADIRGRPLIDRDMVVAISHSGRLAALDLRTGQRLWEQDIAGEHQPWVAGDYIYVISDNDELYCLTRQEGLVRWELPLPRYENPKAKKHPIGWIGPVLAGDRLIMIGTDAYAIAVSPYTGELLGRIGLPARALIEPVVADNTLLIMTNDGTLSAYR